MMKMAQGMLALAVVIGAVSTAAAHGGKSGAQSGVVHSAPVGDCGGAIAADPCAGGVAYVDQVMTGYRTELRTRTVNRQVSRLVTREVEEKFTYQEMVAVTTPEKQTRKVYRTVTKEVPFTYTEMVPVTTPQKQMRTVYRTVSKEVPYTYTEMVPTTAPEKQMRTTYKTTTKEVPHTWTVMVPVTTVQKQQRAVTQCVPEQVAYTQNVSRRVAIQEVDPCTGCVRTVCKTICEPVTCVKTVKRMVTTLVEVDVPVTTYQAQQKSGTRVVCEVVPHTEEVVVNVTRYNPVQRQGTRTVCEVVAHNEEVVVNVTTCQPQQKTGTRTVCELVSHDEEVTVNVTRCVPTTREGVRKRLVAECVTETVPVTENYTEQVPYQYTVRVALNAEAPVATEARGGLFSGLFGRLCGCK